MKHHLALMPLSLSEALCTTCACEDGANIGNSPTTLSSGRWNTFLRTLEVSSKVRCLQLEGHFSWISQDASFPLPYGLPTKALGRRHRVLRDSPFHTDHYIWLCHHDWLCLKHKHDKNKEKDI